MTDDLPENDLGRTRHGDPARIAQNSRKRGGRRRAKPAPGASVYGPYTPISIRVELRRGRSELWYAVERGEDAFHVNGDVALHDLVQRIIAGELMVTDTTSTRRARSRR